MLVLNKLESVPYFMAPLQSFFTSLITAWVIVKVDFWISFLDCLVIGIQSFLARTGGFSVFPSVGIPVVVSPSIKSILSF